MASTPTRVSAFRGLNNVTDPVRLGLPWLTLGINVNITGSGAVSKRSGYARAVAGNPAGAYATRDESRLYLVDGGALLQVHEDLSVTTLATGLGTGAVHWAEINDQVFFLSGDASGIITAEGGILVWRWQAPGEPALAALAGGSLAAGQYQVCCTCILPDGRETGASPPATIELGEGSALLIRSIPQYSGGRTRVYLAPAGSTVFQLVGVAAAGEMTWNLGPEHLGQELLTMGLDALPLGAGPIAEWRGRIYAAMYLHGQDQSVVWVSDPLAPHLFDLAAGYFMVPGRVHALAPHAAGLVVGTDRALHAYTPEGMALLASYGVAPGMPWARDGQRLLIWTQRGLCQFPDFTNLTERRVSVAPGVHAGAALIEQDGQTRFVVALHAGGIAFNPRKEVSP